MPSDAGSWRGSPDDPAASGQEETRAETFAFICCSPYARSGVTTTARLIADHYVATRREFVGFDADPHEPDFAPRFGRRVRNVDIAAVQGQIALIDGLLADDGLPKIVDLWSRSYARFFDLIEQIGFVTEARSHGVEPIFLFHVSDFGAAPAAAWALASRFPDVETLLVHNEGAAPLQGEIRERLDAYPPHRRLRIGPLDPLLRQWLSPPGLSLSYFLLDPPEDMSLVVRSGLKSWLSPIFAQLRGFEMRQALNRARFLS